jgi:hypothetical protein
MAASVWLVRASGPEVIVVSGATVSGSTIVQEYPAGVGSTLPSGSLATTRSSWSPRGRSVYSAGEVQAAEAPLSSEHSKVEPSTLDERLKLALVLVVGLAGPDRIVVSGYVGSTTVQVRPAGVGSTLPFRSTACTRKVWVPRVSSDHPISTSGI